MVNNGLLARFLNGDVTVEQLEDRIRKEEPRLHAWVEIRLESSTQDGPLKGVPYGVKDIVETNGYRTTYGSALFADHVSDRDAALIEVLRSKGAVIMGKTQTTSFAYFDPAPTRNPRNTAHTPGGSSSGSAAAVASGMVPFAIGTQTQGSIIRPASFCGITGFKPTFGALPVQGIMPFAPMLDTAGFMTETALDLRALWAALGHDVSSPYADSYGMIESPVDPEMQEAFRHAVQVLGNYGCKIKRITPPPSWQLLTDAVVLIQAYEGARSMEPHFLKHGSAIGVKLAQLVRDGLAMSSQQYDDARGVLLQCRQDMAEVFETFPVILSAAAPGPAPSGLAFTGSPRCNAPWTGLHTPAMTIPIPVGEHLPMGLQMTAAPGQDALLIATGCHCFALLAAGGAQT